MWIENGFNQASTYFDGEHIRMKEINATIRRASFIEDTIKANASLRVKEQSGFEIKKLTTQFRMTPEIMEFSNFLLKTKLILWFFSIAMFFVFVYIFRDYLIANLSHLHFIQFFIIIILFPFLGKVVEGMRRSSSFPMY